MSFTIKGKVYFRSGHGPSSIPNGSYLIVKIQENLNDIVKKEYPLNSSYVKGSNIEYSINTNKLKNGEVYGMAAVLNMGWKADDEDWIQDGDFLNDNFIPLEFQGKDANVDIELITFP